MDETDIKIKKVIEETKIPTPQDCKFAFDYQFSDFTSKLWSHMGRGDMVQGIKKLMTAISKDENITYEPNVIKSTPAKCTILFGQQPNHSLCVYEKKELMWHFLENDLKVGDIIPINSQNNQISIEIIDVKNDNIKIKSNATYLSSGTVKFGKLINKIIEHV